MVRPDDAPGSVVVQTSFLGDVILTTPLLSQLAARGPVDVVVTPTAASLLSGHPDVRSVIVYDKRGRDRGLLGLWRTARSLRARYRADVVASGGSRGGGARPIIYLAQGSVRSGLLAYLAGFADRVGFDNASGRSLYTRRVPYREDRHHVERLWSLAAPASTADHAPNDLRPRLFPSTADVQAVDSLLERAGHRGEPLIALAPGSAWATKRWPYYPALAASLASRARVVVVGGPDDRLLGAEIAAAVAGTSWPAIDATAALPLLGTAELIGRCMAVVTNDSAAQHLAAATNTPTITVFGPTVAAFGFGPLAPRHAVAGVEGLPCRPCDRHGPARCPLGHWRCMGDLSAARVEALLRQLEAPLAADSPARAGS